MATVKTLIGNVKGPKGDKGEQGVPGTQGATGPQGPAYTLTDTDKNSIAAAVKASLNASDVMAGTFAGQVVANSSGQTPGTSLLRNSKLVSADTNPTVNGEICWTYK